MYSVILRCSILCMLALGVTVMYAQQPANINKDRFAGLHFDFHAGLTDSGIGKTFTPEMIDSFLAIVKPDFLQVDCKGHPGISSYPTKAGNPAPAFAKDIMKIWRDETNKYKVPLYVHYSGLWDNRALQLHPNWARYNADGKPDNNATSLFGGYADSLLIPQIKELATVYHLDGIWVDGDCWVLSPDYSTTAREQFIKQTGITDIPKHSEEPHFFEWMEFHRKAFRDYITKYANAAHAVAPDFKVTSNWSFSSMMPEPVDVPVDYLSGDVAGTNSLYSSAFESRCLALQGKPWDLMSWSFAWKNNSKATKSVIQLEQEAAEVLAMGGGFQTYWQQNRDGSPEPYQFRKMQQIIAFCKERKAYTFKGETVPQIGLLYSTYAWKRSLTGALYSSHEQNAMKGVLNMLLDSKFSVEILMDHQLGKINQYPLLIIPEWRHIDPAVRTQLNDYVNNGGKLLVIGASAVKDFEDMLQVNFGERDYDNKTLFAGLENKIVMMHTAYQPVSVADGSVDIGTQLTADDWRFVTKNVLSTIRSSGKGKIAGIYMDMGDFYTHNQNPVSLQLLQSVIRSMVPAFISTIKADGKIHQAVSKKNDKTYIHLINAGGPHDNPDVLVYDDLAPIKNIELKLQLEKAPAKILLQPGNLVMPFHYNKGIATVSVPELKVYSILEIQ
ncbi:MAG: hypothetical protein QM802_19290 [Agriterribacter sp.]